MIWAGARADKRGGLAMSGNLRHSAGRMLVLGMAAHPRPGAMLAGANACDANAAHAWQQHARSGSVESCSKHMRCGIRVLQDRTDPLYACGCPLIACCGGHGVRRVVTAACADSATVGATQKCCCCLR